MISLHSSHVYLDLSLIDFYLIEKPTTRLTRLTHNQTSFPKGVATMSFGGFGGGSAFGGGNNTNSAFGSGFGSTNNNNNPGMLFAFFLCLSAPYPPSPPNKLPSYKQAALVPTPIMRRPVLAPPIPLEVVFSVAAPQHLVVVVAIQVRRAISSASISSAFI